VGVFSYISAFQCSTLSRRAAGQRWDGIAYKYTIVLCFSDKRQARIFFRWRHKLLKSITDPLQSALAATQQKDEEMQTKPKSALKPPDSSPAPPAR
jgi:hypothetical protein